MSATLELVSRIALKWLEKRPFSSEARARRKAKRAARRAGKTTEFINQPEESDMNTQVFVQIVLGLLRHAMTALAPLGIALSDDALVQFATVIVTGVGLIWSAMRKVNRASGD